MNPQLTRIVAPALVALSGRSIALGAGTYPPVIDLSSLNGSNGYVITGSVLLVGRSVASAGDLNGDGVGDIIIGAHQAAANGHGAAGRSFVVFGGEGVGASGFFDLAALNGVNGFSILGIDELDASGFDVASAGDINGDGIDDVIIGAKYADPPGQPDGGESYILFGKDTEVSGPFSPSLQLSALNGFNGFVARGAGHAGSSVSGAGDVNGDGIDDFIIGAPYGAAFGVFPGRAHVVFGSEVIAIDGSMDLLTHTSLEGFSVHSDATFGKTGFAVSSVGDVNGDGIDDIVVGAPGAEPNGLHSAGEAYVVFGKDTAVSGGFAGMISSASLNGSDGFVIKGIDLSDFLGRSVSTAGDVNGDGIDDILIGAPFRKVNDYYFAGQTYVVFGKNTAVNGAFPASVEASSLNGANGFAINGITAYDWSGFSVSPAGDVNGDGIGDVLIGAYPASPGGETYAGQAYVVFGRNSTASGPFGASVDLSSLNGANGFVLNGIDPGDLAGYSVAGAGDVNDDGIDDLLIGAPAADPFGRTNYGEVYVVFGRVCRADIDGDGDTNAADFVILAGNFGASVTPNTNGDLNGDGVVSAADFVILAGDFGCGIP